MALIIEDGNIIVNANSYVTLVEARAYALQRGVTLPTDDNILEPLLISAMDYLESKRAEYQGRKTEPLVQELQFPRVGVKIDCVAIDSDFIPKELKSAQNILAMEGFAGTNLQPTRNEGFVTEEKTGPITTKYSEKIGVGVAPTMTAVNALLEPLFYSCGQKFALSTLRV